MKIFPILCTMVLSLALSALAENWPRFRGPAGQGISSERNLPLHWGADSNVVWKTEIPGDGWSSPIVWGDRVFVTSTAENGVSCRIIAVDRKTGVMVWNKEVFQQEPRRKENKNSWASPTPVTDGERVYVVFGDGSVAAVTFDGVPVWANREVKFYSRHGLGASPILHDGLLIMAYDGTNPVAVAGQYPNNSQEEQLGWRFPWDKAEIVALDAKTGKRVWVAKRGLSRVAHVTPNILNENGSTQLISPAGDVIQGFSLKTGERIWSVYSQGEGVTPSFAMGDGLIFTSSGFEKTTIRTVRTGGAGDVTASHIAWEQRKGTPTQPSFLYVRPYLYAITEGGIAHCYKGESGEVVWSERVGGNHSASPVYADGKIYFLSEEGETAIIEAGPEFKVVARNSIKEKCQASIAISQGNLFIRSAKNLFCIGAR